MPYKPSSTPMSCASPTPSLAKRPTPSSGPTSISSANITAAACCATRTFLNSFTAERDKINAWVEEQTKQRIRDLIPKLPPELGSQVRLILVNAIYFKGFWMSPFDEKQTRKEEFLLA